MMKAHNAIDILIEDAGNNFVAGNVEGALSEAAFLTGVERNSDVVVLASYAPLFARVGYAQWSPDMIWFDGEKSYGTPSYHVQCMYSNHMGDVTLDTNGQEKETAKDFSHIKFERVPKKYPTISFNLYTFI